MSRQCVNKAVRHLPLTSYDSKLPLVQFPAYYIANYVVTAFFITTINVIARRRAGVYVATN